MVRLLAEAGFPESAKWRRMKNPEPGVMTPVGHSFNTKKARVDLWYVTPAFFAKEDCLKRVC